MRKLLLVVACVIPAFAFALSANASGYQVHEMQVAEPGIAGLGCTGWVNGCGGGVFAGAAYESGICYAAVSNGSGDMVLLTEGFALGVNRSGQAVGYSNGAAMWDSAGNLTHLSLPNNAWFSQAHAINDSGAITGECWVGTSDVRDYITLWNGGGGPVSLGEGCGNAINASGAVAGYTKDAAGTHHAFIWSPTSGLSNLAGGTASEANGLNALGQAVGMICDSSAAWACIWNDDGSLKMLSNLPGATGSTAWGTNDAGLVVGSCDTAAGTFAVLWQPDGSVLNLGALPGNTSSVAYAVTSTGAVAGCSMDSAGSPHAVIWSVVPEPMSVLVLMTGLAALLPRRRRR